MIKKFNVSGVSCLIFALCTLHVFHIVVYTLTASTERLEDIKISCDRVFLHFSLLGKFLGAYSLS